MSIWDNTVLNESFKSSKMIRKKLLIDSYRLLRDVQEPQRSVGLCGVHDLLSQVLLLRGGSEDMISDSQTLFRYSSAAKSGSSDAWRASTASASWTSIC